jgi:hypothetical protein
LHACLPRKIYLFVGSEDRAKRLAIVFKAFTEKYNFFRTLVPNNKDKNSSFGISLKFY